MKTSNFLIGLVAGAVLGIVFAPDKGCNTRKKIAKKSSELTDNIKDTFSDFLAKVENKFTSLSMQTEELAEEMFDVTSQNIEKINKQLSS